MKDNPTKIDDLRQWSTYKVDILIRNKWYKDQIIYTLDIQAECGALWLGAPKIFRNHIFLDWDDPVYNVRFVCKGFARTLIASTNR